MSWLQHNFFVLEVVHARIRPGAASARTLHHRGRREFAIDGRTLKLPSPMK